MALYELRTYTLYVGKMGEAVKVYQEYGWPVFEKVQDKLVGYFQSDVGMLNQLVHLILRNALDECADPYVLRAAELFFRPQRVSVHDGTVLLADAELIWMATPEGARAIRMWRAHRDAVDLFSATMDDDWHREQARERGQR